MAIASPIIAPAVVEALAIAGLPDVEWTHGDDLCDCIFQRIGLWKNPYLAETLEVRMCCIWAELYKQFPDFVRTIPGYWLDNEQRWETVPWEWNGETDMPTYLWYRHLARKQGRTVGEIRAEYADRDAERPRGRALPAPPPPARMIPFILLDGSQEIRVDLGCRVA